MMSPNCIFCRIIKGEIKAEKVDESDNFIAIRAAHPKTQGHTLIIPKMHLVTIIDLPNKLGNELLEFTKKISYSLLEKKYGDGFNVIMNNLAPEGQVVEHAHIHIIPRKEGDGLRSLA